EDTRLQRRVALKVPHFDAGEAPTDLERFYREARIAAGIHHPNLCAVHDVDAIDGVHYLVMPFLDGVPLSDALKSRQPWPPERALPLVRRVAEALAALHAHGIVHRDLKPGNIFLLPSGEPVVMDFGLARSLTATKQLTQTGETVGTPAYMAPEQTTGSRTELGPAAHL